MKIQPTRMTDYRLTALVWYSWRIAAVGAHDIPALALGFPVAQEYLSSADFAGVIAGRKQLALLRQPTVVRQALMDAVIKNPGPRVQWHEPGDVYCLDWKFTRTAMAIAMGTGHLSGECNLYRRHQPRGCGYRAVRQLR